MDPQRSQDILTAFWRDSALPALTDYIRIPNVSADFDPDWEAHGHMQRVLDLAKAWAEQQGIRGLTAEIVGGPGRVPALLIEIEGTRQGDVLLYGHLDKQPPLSGWDDGLGPWEPVVRDGKLYGRGAADDGYALFAIIAAAHVLQTQDLAHPRLVALVECGEESGSVDLPYYVETYAARIGVPQLIVCLDSGCGDYERLWTTTSLRGALNATITARVLTEGVHSGDASGIVPSSMRVMRLLLDRIEDAQSGHILPAWLHAKIPDARMDEVRSAATALGSGVTDTFPWIPGVRPMATDAVELLLNRTWRPTLSITGQAGMPDLKDAGNVLRPWTSLKISLRLPPSLAVAGLEQKLITLLTTDPPCGAQIEVLPDAIAAGWEAPVLAPWLRDAIIDASLAYFGKEPASFGEGGSIPFMAMLGEKFPEAQFLITGVLGPKSNAHGPNEFLHLQAAERVSACVAAVIAATQGDE